MPDVLLQQGLTLLLLAILAFLVTGLGRLALHKMTHAFAGFGEQVFFCTGIGFGILGYTVFFLGSIRALSSLPLSSLLLFLFLFSIVGWWKVQNSSIERNAWGYSSKLEYTAAVLLLVCLAAAFLLTLTPESGKDALIYHLAVPKLFLDHQGFFFIPGNIFSHYPLHSEMLFLVGLFLQGDILAKGMHFLAFFSILLGIYQFTRHRMHAIEYPVLTMLIFCAIPSVFVVSHMAYNDLFVTFYSMAAVFAFINWFSRSEDGWLLLSGVFTGLAIAVKYTALLLPFLGSFGILWAARHRRFPTGRTFRFLLVYGLVAGIIGSPFYIKNWIMTGNPFYPFLYGIFGGKGWEPDQAQYYDYFVQTLGMGRSFLDYILLPWNLSFHATMDSPRFDGIIGPLFILTLPFAFMIRKFDETLKIIIAYCLLTFMFWASSAQQIRYLIPIFPFLAILVGSVLTSCKKEKFYFALITILIAGSLAFNGSHIVKNLMKIKPIDVVVGRESRAEFLNRMLPSFTMYDYMNRHLPADSKIFLIYMKNWTFLCDRECYSDSMFESYTIQKILSRSSASTEVAATLRKEGFTHILCDMNYIYGAVSTFSPDEKSLFTKLREERLQTVHSHGSYFLYRIRDP
jgi:hypothetical protein